MTRANVLWVAALAGALVPATAQGQAYRCAVPATIPAPRPDLPSRDQPRRVVPIGGYTLAISWVPEYCRGSGRTNPSARFECRSGNRFGFALHGLWPDGEGPEWPQYCRATRILPPAVIRSAICATPSAQLIQHEWAKHGTCMNGTPNDYFRQSTRLFAALRYPNMQSLSRRRDLTAGILAAEMAQANPGVSATMMRITANKQGWLDEVWLCLDKDRRYRACPAHQGGLSPDTPIKIWRGPR